MSDVFDDLFSLITPERLLLDSRANGEGVAVCVIDSGVESSVLRAKHGPDLKPIQGAVFTADCAEPLPYEGHQSTPHGTTVADILLTQAPAIQLYSADVFGPAGTCEVETVIKALHWAYDVWKCKVINLSLGVTEQKLQQLPKKQQLLRTIEEGYFKDVLIVAAAHNDHPFTRSYPAMFAPPILSVDKQLFGNPLQFAYEPHEQIEFQAHGRGYLGPFAMEPATSWAAPHLSGIAARLLSLRPGLKPFEVKTLLYWLCKNDSRKTAEGTGVLSLLVRD
ncbi:MAG: S8 family serine peptidase [Planctomycetes bacterium]|nr:S8 family serine peptidase [Planctomycetota bacterium]